MSTSLVIDACSAINLLGTGSEVEIAAALDWTLHMVPEAKAEVMTLRGEADPDGIWQRIPVDWGPLERSGRLVSRPLNRSGADLDFFVDAATRLTDVDARSVALAGALALPLLSDDGKVRKVFLSLHPHLQLLSTLGSVRRAITKLGPGDHDVRALAQRLRHSANFAPPKDDPERDWYLSLLDAV